MPIQKTTISKQPKNKPTKKRSMLDVIKGNRNIIVVGSIATLIAFGAVIGITSTSFGNDSAKAAVASPYNPYFSKCLPDVNQRPVLQLGAKDSADLNIGYCVKALQRGLNDCCGQGLLEDGNFGASTKQAVINFQTFFSAARKDGVVDANTWGGIDYIQSIAIKNAGLSYKTPLEVWNISHNVTGTAASTTPAAPAPPSTTTAPVTTKPTTTVPVTTKTAPTPPTATSTGAAKPTGGSNTTAPVTSKDVFTPTALELKAVEKCGAEATSNRYATWLFIDSAHKCFKYLREKPEVMVQRVAALGYHCGETLGLNMLPCYKIATKQSECTNPEVIVQYSGKFVCKPAEKITMCIKVSDNPFKVDVLPAEYYIGSAKDNGCMNKVTKVLYRCFVGYKLVAAPGKSSPTCASNETTVSATSPTNQVTPLTPADIEAERAASARRGYTSRSYISPQIVNKYAAQKCTTSLVPIAIGSRQAVARTMVYQASAHACFNNKDGLVKCLDGYTKVWSSYYGIYGNTGEYKPVLRRTWCSK